MYLIRMGLLNEACILAERGYSTKHVSYQNKTSSYQKRTSLQSMYLIKKETTQQSMYLTRKGLLSKACILSERGYSTKHVSYHYGSHFSTKHVSYQRRITQQRIMLSPWATKQSMYMYMYLLLNKACALSKKDYSTKHVSYQKDLLNIMSFNQNGLINKA